MSSSKDTPSPSRGVPIVGVGASAGGLEALEQFLAHVPAGCGLAFVIVQHLDPTRKGMLVELLQQTTAMPVVQIKDRMKVEPDHVYIIPPDRDLSVLHGRLHLLEPVEPRGLRLPIDFFFRSLADDQREFGIGVILSGMGSDGTLGARAIKEKGGAVFVQTPASAKFDSMPRSAIDAGLADSVVPAEELAASIFAHRQSLPVVIAPLIDQPLTETDQSGLEKVVLLLRAQTGHDFSLYKKSTIHRRIERRMGLHQLRKIADYVRYLRENPQEADLLFKELLIGVTSFFRDPAVWAQLKADIIPALLAAHPNGGVLRVWVAGCSTGEEAYSLAMVFLEVLEQVKPPAQYGLQVFATDLDKDAIDKARAGTYSAKIGTDVSDARLSKFFVKEDHGYRVGKTVREMVIFAPQNLVMDPPFTKLDLVTCRNLLIYLEADLQKKLLPLFHYSLKAGGILMLGSSETVGQSQDLFAPLPGKNRLYRRQDENLRAGLVDFPAAFVRTRADKTVASALPQPSTPAAPNLQALTESLLLKSHTPAAVLVTGKGDILYISGKVGKYLEPAAGKANLNLFAMTRDGLSLVLNEALPKAIRQNAALTFKGVKTETSGGGVQSVDVTLHPLAEPAALRGMVLIVFTPATAVTTAKPIGKSERVARDGARLLEMTQDLQQCREDLQTTREEMQTSQEELRSSNEELQSTNEELQSTNEELTTSKEEMQSMNEELQTVNNELQAKVDELSRSSDDMVNLLNSTDIATLFLDGDLKVRRFTKQTAAIIKLIPGDAGRPITDLVSELDYPGLADDAREVLRSLMFQERQVPARAGRSFRVRIMPYRTQDNRIDGLVITFVDISQSKHMETTLREAQTVLKSRFSDQTVKLDASKTLESVLRKAQAVLEKQLADQTLALKRTRTTPRSSHPKKK